MPPITEIIEPEKKPLDTSLEQEGDVAEDELLDDESLDETDADSGDESADADDEEADPDPQDDKNPDEVVVSIDGEEPAQAEDPKTPQWVKDLRKNQKELQRQNRELQKKLEQAEKTTAPKVEPVGKRPSLDDEGINYDTDKYDAAIDAWYRRKQAAEQAERDEAAAETQRQQAWKSRLGLYEDSKKQLRVQDFADAEATVFALLDVTQQGIIVQGADNPAAVVYALNNHPAKLAELAGMKDPVQFAVAIGKLETRLKMTPRKAPPPPPERPIRGSGTGKTGTFEAVLEKLRAEAEQTGDYTKVTEHKRKMRKQQA